MCHHLVGSRQRRQDRGMLRPKTVPHSSSSLLPLSEASSNFSSSHFSVFRLSFPLFSQLSKANPTTPATRKSRGGGRRRARGRHENPPALPPSSLVRALRCCDLHCSRRHHQHIVPDNDMPLGPRLCPDSPLEPLGL